MYEITPYTKAKAKQLNVIVKPSTRKGKKLDVYDKKGNYIVSVGAQGYFDYPTYKIYFGKQIADERRRLYKKRHSKDRSVKNTAGYFADRLLW